MRGGHGRPHALVDVIWSVRQEGADETENAERVETTKTVRRSQNYRDDVYRQLGIVAEDDGAAVSV
ncbi:MULTISPECIES: hypothetical protein [Mycobacterium]|uniref:Uncharacterized protein n=1 Tax=Mycobacterium syngnathidarum TaxID=1908205 RepID=A0A1S1JUX1_9MYCO|nr:MULTISPECIES: hypothetical protein [Mycobacterium]MCG7611185.1 hypothetical protein [Mycobacterium sp. CnD-18-1]OHT90980.1 hypothetical protein BKG61_26255 [Mycobacterium syngnathidarum]OLT98392.1 hypothetical protein BKG60_01640 [Mycobacterium syngnathidarum]